MVHIKINKMNNKTLFEVCFENKKEKIKDVKFLKHNDLCFILTTKHNVYNFTSRSDIFDKRLSFSCIRVAQNISMISCGDVHLACLSVDGSLNVILYYKKQAHWKRDVPNNARCDKICSINNLLLFTTNEDTYCCTADNRYIKNYHIPNPIVILEYKNSYKNEVFDITTKIGEKTPFSEDNIEKFGIVLQFVGCRGCRAVINKEGKVYIWGNDFYGLEINGKWKSETPIELPLKILLQHTKNNIYYNDDDIICAKFIRLTESYFYIELEITKPNGKYKLHKISWKIFQNYNFPIPTIENIEAITTRFFKEGSFFCEGYLEVVDQIEKISESSLSERKRETQRFIFDALNSDIKFIVEGKEIKANKNILSSASEVFNKMFSDHGFIESKTDEITINEEKFNVYRVFIRFLYCAEIQKNIEFSIFDYIDLAGLAKYHELKYLATVCQENIQKLLSEENMINALVKVDSKFLHEIRSVIADFIKNRA